MKFHAKYWQSVMHEDGRVEEGWKMDSKSSVNGHPVAVPDTRRVTPEPTSVAGSGWRVKDLTSKDTDAETVVVEPDGWRPREGFWAETDRWIAAYDRTEYTASSLKGWLTPKPQPWYRRLWQRIRGL